MSFFTITYSRNLKSTSSEVFFENLIANFDRTYYKNIERINPFNLKIEGFFFSLKSNYSKPSNIWTSFTKQTQVSLLGNEVKYVIDFSYAIIFSILNFLWALVMTFILLEIQDLPFSVEAQDIIIFVSILYWVIALITFIYKLLKHRSILNYTIKYGSKFKGSYDWDKILTNKTNQELRDIVNGNTTLTKEVQEIAKNILNNRQK